MSLSIYDIDLALIEASEALNNVFDEETGEVTDIDVFEALKAEIDGLQMARDQKISNVACWYKSLVAEAEAIKAEKQKLAKRQTVAENKAENLKKYLEYALNGEKFKDARVSISYRRSEGIHFADDFDGNTLPKEYLRIKAEPKLTEIKEAIKSGKEFEGISLIEKQNIQIK